MAAPMGFVLALLLSTFTVFVDADCQSVITDGNQPGEKWCWNYGGQRTFASGKSYCESLSSTLVSAHTSYDDDQNDAMIQQYASSSGWDYWLGIYNYGNPNLANPADWVWLDGSPQVFTDWGTDGLGFGTLGPCLVGRAEPEGAPGSAGRNAWFDYRCDVALHILCKVKYCEGGYTLDQSSGWAQCVPSCHVNAETTGAVCTCNDGYSGDGINLCSNVDECSESKDN
eukprot:2430512-Rhodomonas_salina.1